MGFLDLSLLFSFNSGFVFLLLVSVFSSLVTLTFVFVISFTYVVFR